MGHQGQKHQVKITRRQTLQKLAKFGMVGLTLVGNTGSRSGGGGLGARIRDCRLFNVFRRQPQAIVASTDPCCTGGVVSGAVVSTGDPCGTPVVASVDPCASTGATVIQQQGAIIQTTPSGITVPSSQSSTLVPDLAPLDNKPTSNLDPKGASFNRPITSTPSTLQAKTNGSTNFR